MRRFSMGSILAVLTAMMILAYPISARAEVLDSHSHWSGSLSITGSDIVDDTGDGTGSKASVSDLTERGTLGIAAVRVVSEISTNPTGYFTANCQAPYFVEFGFVAHSSVTRYASTGDLLSTLMDSGYLCLDPYSGGFVFSVDVNIVGGTGQFAGATGTANATGGGQFLLTSANGRAAFASLDGHTVAHIVTPGRAVSRRGL